LDHDPDAKKIYDRFISETSYEKTAAGKSYYELRDLKKCLESIYLSQTADQEYFALIEDLKSKHALLERARGESQFPIATS